MSTSAIAVGTPLPAPVRALGLPQPALVVWLRHVG